MKRQGKREGKISETDRETGKERRKNFQEKNGYRDRVGGCRKTIGQKAEGAENGQGERKLK
jgi:hypothetical protein